MCVCCCDSPTLYLLLNESFFFFIIRFIFSVMGEDAQSLLFVAFFSFVCFGSYSCASERVRYSESLALKILNGLIHGVQRPWSNDQTIWTGQQIVNEFICGNISNDNHRGARKKEAVVQVKDILVERSIDTIVRVKINFMQMKWNIQNEFNSKFKIKSTFSCNKLLSDSDSDTRPFIRCFFFSSSHSFDFHFFCCCRCRRFCIQWQPTIFESVRLFTVWQFINKVRVRMPTLSTLPTFYGKQMNSSHSTKNVRQHNVCTCSNWNWIERPGQDLRDT